MDRQSSQPSHLKHTWVQTSLRRARYTTSRHVTLITTEPRPLAWRPMQLRNPLFSLTELLGHSLGDGHGGDTPGLRAADDAAAREAHLGHVLGHLCRLPRAGLSDHHKDAVPARVPGGTEKNNQAGVRRWEEAKEPLVVQERSGLV